MTALNKDDLAASYVQARDRIAARDAANKEANLSDKMLMDKIELYFKGLSPVEGVDSWKTKHGTIYFTTKFSAKLVDPEAYFDYTITNSAWDLVEKRANVSAVRAFVESTGQLPPGVELSSRIEVNIRRPSSN